MKTKEEMDAKAEKLLGELTRKVCNHRHSTDNVGLIQKGSPRCPDCKRWYVKDLEPQAEGR